MILLGFCVSSYNLSAILEAKSSLWLFYVKKWHQKSFLFSGIMLKKLMSKLHGENSSFFRGRRCAISLFGDVKKP